MNKYTNALIATVFAVAVLPIGEARAALDLDDVLVCRNVSTDPGIPAAGVCGPDVNPILDYGETRFTWVTSPAVIPVADLFDVSFGPSSIILTFTADASGRFNTADENVLLLGDINPIPDEFVRIQGVGFDGIWLSQPSEDPTFNNTGLPGNTAQIRWDLGGASPSAGDTAEIFLEFFGAEDIDKLFGAYKGSNTTISISPSGCSKAIEKNVDTVVGLGSMDVDFAFPFAGCWAMTGYSFDNVGVAAGLYIERKVGKDLTMSLTGDSLYDGIVDAMNNYLEFDPDASKCDYVDNGTIYDEAIVTKAHGVLSKNGEQLRVGIYVDSKYENTSGKTKRVKAKIKGTMNFDSLEENPAFNCGLIH
jgi:hypothetical protein